MKLSAVQTTQPYTYKNKNQKIAIQPAFKAKVEIVRDLGEPFLKLAQAVLPSLKKLDANLRIKIDKAEIWRMFRSDLKGLKFDIGYIDQKKAYIKVLEQNAERPFLKRQTIQGLKDKDESLLYMFSQSGRVGFCVNPKNIAEEQFTKTAVALVKREIEHMPKKLLEHPKIEKLPNGKFFVNVCDPVFLEPPYSIYR